MSPFTIAIIIGIILMGISLVMNPNWFVLNPLFLIGMLVFGGGVMAHLKKWWTRGYN